jgi:immune inhibitor A
MNSAIRLAAFVLPAIILLQPAWATVRPPDEELDTPQKLADWQAFAPTLVDWEFKPQPPMTGSTVSSLDGIRAQLGRTTAQVADELQDASGTAALKLDLNLDGRIDQFDVLELGYQVQPRTKSTSIAPSSGTNKWLVLRSDFTDVNATYGTYTVGYFNQRLFQDGAAMPSLHDFYEEVSYGALNITGTIDNHGPNGDGWYKGSHTKTWYHNNGGNWLVRESVLAADPSVDFSQYDVDGDGYVDTLCVYYPGPVMWNGGLHPHRSSGLNIHVDGVIVDSYFLSVVDTSADSWLMTIGSHEYGHILGLPDLYDVNGGSSGVGSWSLMAYQYDNQQLIPSPDPWCKAKLGWVTPIVVTDNVDNYSLGCYQDQPKVLKIWTDGRQGSQYFLVANYRQKKTDTNRAGQGLLVLHIDDTIGGGDQDNANEDRKHVDVESARGYADPNLTNPKDPLDDGADQGQANDLWFTGNSDSSYTGIFDDDSNPFARDYPNPGNDSLIKLSDISASADTMTLDIQVETADHPTCDITAPVGGGVSGNVTVDVTATAASGRSISKVEFYCNEAYLGQDTSSPYSLTFNSKCIYDGSRVIRAVATDNTGSIDTDIVTVTVSNSATSLPYSNTFETGVGDCAIYDFSGSRRWESKTQAYAGSLSAGIGDVTNGYDYDEHDALVTLRLSLSGATHPIARWRQRYRVSGGENTCKVFITSDGGATQQLLGTWTGSNLSWHPAAVDLLDYVGDEVYLLFRLDSSSLNRISSEGGWWIDNLEVRELSTGPSITSITPGDGSSFGGVQTITVSATDDEGVERVDMFVDGTDKIYTDYSAPFTFDWNSDWVFNAGHSFTAVAYDADLQSDDLTVGWTTTNAGLALPWTENFDTDPGTAWRGIDGNGAGYWHRLATGGYSGGPGMYFGITNTYDDNESDWYISPTLYINGLPKSGFGWVHRYDIEANYDYARVYVTTNLSTWTQLAVYSATNQGWQSGGARLDSYNNQRVKLAFCFESDGGVVEEGWYVDQLRLAAAPQISSITPNPVRNGQNVTITGSSFGSGPADDFRRVTISGTNASIVSWGDTSITATVPANVASGSVIVYRRGVASDGYALTVKLPPPNLGGLGQL